MITAWTAKEIKKMRYAVSARSCTVMWPLTRTTGSECRKESPRALGSLFQRVGQVLIFKSSVTIPDPYPLNLPDGVELPECWYVVDRGTEVGIFADK